MDKQTLKKRWIECWAENGVHAGDTILLHSAIGRTLRNARADGVADIDPEDLLDSFLAALGPRGTLLLPLFNFDFTKGVPFDIRHTPSQMGALTEAGRLHAHAVRTGHPIYSFAVIGHRAKDFEGVVNESGYGPDSPFAILRRIGGKISVLDLPDQNSMTFYHYVEEMHAVDYRYHKGFAAPYTDYQGVTSVRTFKLFVRDLEKGVQTDVDAMGERLWDLGLYQGSRPNLQGGLRTIHAEALFGATSDVIREGRALGLLYSIGEKGV